MAIRGSHRAQTAGYTPMQMPIGTARTVASRKPANTRPVLATMSWNRMPLSAMEARERNTAPGDGRNFSSTRPREAMAAQASSGMSREATCRPPRTAPDGVAPRVNMERSPEPLPLVAAAAVAVIRSRRPS